MDMQAKIIEEIRTHPVMIYIKGTPDSPQCGFSATVVQIFREIGAEMGAADVLNEEGYRDAVKKFTNWPTIPQVFVGGKFIGGCDIIKELHQTGELRKMIEALPKTSS